MRLTVGSLVTATILAGCGGGPAGYACHPTMTSIQRLPPDVARVGSGWFGHGDLYVAIPLQPVRIGDRWHMKVPWFRRIRGVPVVVVRHLDGTGRARIDMPPADAYPSTGPLPTGVDVDRVGCWEISGTLGASTTTVVVRVGPSARG